VVATKRWNGNSMSSRDYRLEAAPLKDMPLQQPKNKKKKSTKEKRNAAAKRHPRPFGDQPAGR